jgi:hypothetical protein
MARSGDTSGLILATSNHFLWLLPLAFPTVAIFDSRNHL